MNANMIETLRSQFAKVETIDPCSPVFHDLQKLLDILDDDSLEMLADAGINFVSSLAGSRCLRRGIFKSRMKADGVAYVFTRQRKAA